MSDVVIANSRRVQESLRSLEEFGKLVSPQFAAAVKQIRYRSYTLQQELAVPAADTACSPRDERIQKLHGAVLYVLITESTCRLPWQQVVEACLELPFDQIILEFDSWTHISVANSADAAPRGSKLIIDRQGVRPLD